MKYFHQYLFGTAISNQYLSILEDGAFSFVIIGYGAEVAVIITGIFANKFDNSL